ncbi:MAG: precorrin-4 C(11)-methyltransferase [Desulfobulbus propionicus]|nr:MAG: precorrin-4 C(11)-methyltransferase [Desulfobulbus propionicus]
MMSKKIVFVGAGPGDPELITVRGRRLLDTADRIIYAGSLVNTVLLDKVKARLYDSAGLDLDEIVHLMKEGWRAGELVVRLHTGDPALYGAIREQIQRLDQENIPYEVVPGVSSAFAAAAALGQELTAPEVSQTVIFTRRAGRTPVPEREGLEHLALIGATMCIFLSAAMMEKVVAELMAGGYSGDTPAAVVARVSWPDQQVVRGCLADIAGKAAVAGISKTAVILVGGALGGEPGPESLLYASGFSHGYRTGRKKTR